MAPRSRRLLVLAALFLVASALAGYRHRSAQTAGAAAVPSNRAAGRATDPTAALQPPVPALKLDELTLPRPEPGSETRNPFRSQPPANPRAVGQPSRPPATASSSPTAPVEPALALIALKFIGLVDGPTGQGSLAILSDGRFVYHGREGDIIDGRYRIVRIGVESVVMEYVDGLGRQTIRLSGS